MARLLATISLLLATGALGVSGQFNTLPGAQSAAQFAAAASDGMSRYLAPNGPIQPGLTAIAGLPMRAAELANRGISSVSSQFGRGARAAASSTANGSSRMPGMETLESSMPASVAQMGESLHGMIKQKNNFIRGQAERGVEAGERLRNMMTSGLNDLQTRSSGSMGRMGHMVGQAQDSMMKSGSKLQAQLGRGLEGAMGQLSSLQGLGDNMREQASGITRTVSNGLQGAAKQLHQTGEQVRQQLQSNHARNTQKMGSMMEGMHTSLGSAMGQASGALRDVISAPMELVRSLGSSLMKSTSGGGGGSGSSSSSSYSKGGRAY